jgi:secondary thiamine-phosphate synthase enzyme
MAVSATTVQIKSRGENDIIDITERASKAVKESQAENGIVTVFVVGSTAAITTIEYEPGLKSDFPDTLSRIAPKGIQYRHDNTWHDGNGHSHVRASLIGPSLTIPIIEGNLALGRWQQIVLIEMDITPRDRKVVMQVIGE